MKQKVYKNLPRTIWVCTVLPYRIRKKPYGDKKSDPVYGRIRLVGLRVELFAEEMRGGLDELDLQIGRRAAVLIMRGKGRYAADDITFIEDRHEAPHCP